VLLLRKFKHRCTIPNVLLCGCEPWSPTFNEEHRLEVFENVALRNILGPERKEVPIQWSKQHNGQLYWFVTLTKYYSGDHIKGHWMGRTWGKSMEKTNMYGRSAENPQCKRYLEDLGVSGNMILKGILKQDGRARIGLIWSSVQRGDGRV